VQYNLQITALLLLEKLKAAQVKELPAFYGTQRLITMFNEPKNSPEFDILFNILYYVSFVGKRC
jgi:hypothetical protein